MYQSLFIKYSLLIVHKNSIQLFEKVAVDIVVTASDTVYSEGNRYLFSIHFSDGIS